MPAADDQADAGKHVAAARQPAGVNVGLQMIHRHQRQIRGPRTASWPPSVRPTASRPAPAYWPPPPRRDRPASAPPSAALRRSPAESARRGPARRSPAPRRRTARAAHPATPRPTTSTSSRSVTTAAAVSSQVVSMVRMFIGAGARSREQESEDMLPAPCSVLSAVSRT